MWKEFKPAVRFLLIFVGLYITGNLVYGFYVSVHGNRPDEITSLVADQSTWILNNIFGYYINATPNATEPTVSLKTGEHVVLNVFEGCNGINVFIVFAAFIVAFNGNTKKSLWFIPLGILVLHVSNLLRIIFLYWTALNFHRYFYYVHKYIFTGVIYAVVFALWIIWMYQLNERKKNVTTE